MGYDFYIFENSTGLRILLTSDSNGEEKSMLSFFHPRQMNLIYRFAFSEGGVCACTEEGKYMAFFRNVTPGVAFAVRFDLPKNIEPPTTPYDCKDELIRRLVSAFDRAEHIGQAYSLFPKDALVDASMLLSEFIKVRTVENDRIAASFGFAVVGEGKLVTLLVLLIIFLQYVLDEKDKLYVEIADCDGVFKADVVFDRELLDDLLFLFPRICGDSNVVMRSVGEKVTVEIIAAIEDDSKIGLKDGIY